MLVVLLANVNLFAELVTRVEPENKKGENPNPGKCEFSHEDDSSGKSIDYYSCTYNFSRTIILMEGETRDGQDMFLRGGIDHDYANKTLGRNCSVGNFECSIPIKT